MSQENVKGLMGLVVGFIAGAVMFWVVANNGPKPTLPAVPAPSPAVVK